MNAELYYHNNDFKKSALVQKLSLSDCSILICVHFMHTMHYSPNLVKVYGYFHQR